MNVPMKWLREWVETGLTPEDLAYRMTMAGLEAEKIEQIGEGWANVFVGLVEEVEPHPNADRLVLADIAAGEHRLTVVTGAPNIAAGQKVALALAGARLYDGHSESKELKTLKPGMIRGIKSEGMACSEKELGISDEHEGILVLAPDAPVGQPLQDYLGDAVIEFEITPNLVHAFSIAGIAREAAALTGATVHRPPIADLAALPPGDARLVEVEAADLCARYVAIVFAGVQVGPSPEWLVRRLTAAGIRPINNVVDVTNYVMQETGQPLHAFDRDTLQGRRVVIRRARPGERMETLDHQDRKLAPDMLVIADDERPVGLAGVIGGLHSEVSDGTTEILLEGANFDMKSVRRTARALKVRTDASARFERGIDPNLAGDAMARAAHLLLKLCPSATVTAVRDVYPSPLAPWQISFPFAKIERLLGIGYDEATVVETLSRLEFAATLAGDGPDRTLTVTVPTFRRDVTIAEDVIEEIARINGYEHLPSTLPVGQASPVFRDPLYLLQRSIRDILVASGASEAVTYVTVADDMLRPFADAGATHRGFLRCAPAAALLRLRNPMQADRALLRPTLVPSLLEAVAANLRHTNSVRLFELGSVYLPTTPDALPDEVPLLAIAMAGRREPVGLFATDEALDFTDLKGVVDELLGRLGVKLTVAAERHPGLHPGRAATLRAGDRLIGRLGDVRPDIAALFEIDETRVTVAEIDLSVLRDLGSAGRREITVPRYLPVQQDFAVIVAEATPAADVERALLDAGRPLATGIALFDVYRGQQIGEGNKSLAYRVTFTAPDRALTDAELVKMRGKIDKVLKQRVGGTLRV